MVGVLWMGWVWIRCVVGGVEDGVRWVGCVVRCIVGGGVGKVCVLWVEDKLCCETGGSSSSHNSIRA